MADALFDGNLFRARFMLLQKQRGGYSRVEAVKRKVAVEGQSTVIPVGEIKLAKKRRKLPAAMISYIKPRRKRRLLPVGVKFPSSHGVKSKVEDTSVKSHKTEVVVKPASAELTGRLTSASIVSRYRHLDQQRSQSRRMSSRSSSVENSTRPSTRSQTAAIMHRQLVIARMKSHEESETPMLQRGAEPLSENYSAASKHASSGHRCSLSLELQFSEHDALSDKGSSSESVARRSTPAVKTEVLEGAESERSMRRFIRRRNVETSDANRG